MNKNAKEGLHALYAKDPRNADEQLWGRKPDPLTRRGFLHNAGLAAMSAALGSVIPFADNMPAGMIPAAFAQSNEGFEIPGKNGLVVLNDRPLNAETPAHLLDERVTSAKHLFVRNNGLPPAMASIDPLRWTLAVDGESVRRKASFTLGELKQRFKHHTYQLQLECGGNGRSEFVPSASGNQW